jgi:ABC-type sugar transport system ATPase subunit
VKCTEIARALFGVDKVTGGKIYFKGKEVKFNNPQQAIEAGMAYITESRKIDGLFLNFNGPKNSTTARIKKLFKSKRLHILDLKKESKTYDESNKQLSIEPRSEYKFVGFLSGGNQQKVVISRWLFAEADFFIMDEPTQGIDVGSRIEVYNIINKFTAAGKSVLLVSSDHLELLSMSDTIGNLKFGKITSIVDARDADEKTNTN